MDDFNDDAEYWHNKFANITFTLAAVLSSLPNKQAICREIDLARFSSWKDVRFSVTQDDLNRQMLIKLDN